MRSVATITLAGLALTAIPSTATAVGEVFKVESSGTEYCDHFDSTKFNAKNNVDTWVYIASEDEWLLSFSPLFTPDTTVTLYGMTYLLSQKKAAFVAAQYFDDAFISIQGTLALNRDGSVKSAKGTFIQSNLVYLGCFSAGKVKTTQRIQ